MQSLLGAHLTTCHPYSYDPFIDNSQLTIFTLESQQCSLKIEMTKDEGVTMLSLPIAFIENLLEFILRLHPYSWILNLTSLTCHNKFLYKNITANIYEHFIAHFDCMNICPKAHNLQPTFFYNMVLHKQNCYTVMCSIGDPKY